MERSIQEVISNIQDNKNIEQMFSMVFGDTSLYSQMLDAENMSEQELDLLATEVRNKLGGTNIRHDRLVRALRRVA